MQLRQTLVQSQDGMRQSNSQSTRVSTNIYQRRLMNLPRNISEKEHCVLSVPLNELYSQNDSVF